MKWYNLYKVQYLRFKVKIPKSLKVIKEITDDNRYKNKSLVKSLKLDEQSIQTVLTSYKKVLLSKNYY